MPDQLSLLPTSPALVPTDLPEPVLAILCAARAVGFSHSVAPGAWGVRIGDGRRWVLVGSCCCPIGAYLLHRDAVADPRETWACDTAARLLGVPVEAVRSLAAGVDGVLCAKDEWYGYGRRVARELGLP